MIKITYPGTNNFSTFVHDGYGRNVSIVETTAGSVTSTKQFVWSGSDRKEERDAAGSLSKKFFGRGQMNSTSKYFYDKDHLGSIREMTDSSGVIQAQYAFDPYGRVSKLTETVASDFGYAGYYIHPRSGLNLTQTRAYSANLGRWISRDSIAELGGINLYGYVGNNPEIFVDPSGKSIWTIAFWIIIIIIFGGCGNRRADQSSGQNPPGTTPSTGNQPPEAVTMEPVAGENHHRQCRMKICMCLLVSRFLLLRRTPTPTTTSTKIVTTPGETDISNGLKPILRTRFSPIHKLV